MQSNTKDRIKVIVFGSVLLIGLAIIGYMFFGKSGTAEVYTNLVKVVAADDLQEIEECKKYNMSYALNIKEDEKYFLEYDNGKYKLTEDQYNELIEGKSYFFNIKYTSSKNTSSGIVKAIYTQNPIQK
ncbi:hypothetical protein [Clostridium culturomicium]|uniref:hypothetical protein n=1 Tax=Clostridium culturomicium TaxID=1499683 RepID=UPI00058EDFD0|nr:hypothetical protein [Clostridium culturomicium]